MKTIGLNEDYESQGMKRTDASSADSDASEHRHRSSSYNSEHSKDKDAGSDISSNSQRQRKLKKSNKKVIKIQNKIHSLNSSNLI